MPPKTLAGSDKAKNAEKEKSNNRVKVNKELLDSDALFKEELNKRYYMTPSQQTEHAERDLMAIREKLVALILSMQENMYDAQEEQQDDNNNNIYMKKLYNIDVSKPIDATFPALRVCHLPYLLHACGLHLNSEQINQITNMTTRRLLKSYLDEVNVNNKTNNSFANLQSEEKEEKKYELSRSVKSDTVDVEKLVHIIHDIHVNGFFTYVPFCDEEKNTENSKNNDSNNSNNSNDNKNKKKSKKGNNKRATNKEAKTSQMKEIPNEKSFLLELNDTILLEIFDALWEASGKQMKVPELFQLNKAPIRCIHKNAMRELLAHKLSNKSSNDSNKTNTSQENKQGKSTNDNEEINKSHSNISHLFGTSSIYNNMNRPNTNIMTEEEIENFLFHCSDASGEWICEDAFVERLHDVHECN